MVFTAVQQFIKGVIDSIHSLQVLVTILENTMTNPTIRNILLYNLCICLPISYILENLPLYIDGVYSIDNTYTYYLYRSMVYILWLLPHYIVGLLYNSYYTNQAISVFIHVYNPQNINLKYVCYGRYSKYLVNKGYYQVIVTFLTFETILISYIPYIGTFMDWLLTSLIYSYYSWEYSWSSHKVPHINRYSIFENNWLYYLGYGSIIGLIKIYCGFFYSTYVIASIFPVFCMNTLILFKREVSVTNPTINLPIFYLPIKYANKLTDKVSDYIKKKLT